VEAVEAGATGSSANPRFLNSSGAMRLLIHTSVPLTATPSQTCASASEKTPYWSIRHFKYPLLSNRHSGSLVPRWARRQRRYAAMMGLHSPSWSSGKEPRSGLEKNALVWGLLGVLLGLVCVACGEGGEH